MMFSLANAAYTFLKKKHYRLFENSVDIVPNTPSARRVRVDSSPVSSSPLQLLTKIIERTTAGSRSHPDPTRDVWEVAIWDPFPICLQLYCLFSPGHVLVYYLFLPILPSNPRPSVTVATTILLELLLTAQLLLLQENFSQQSKDSAIIQKEVLNEYDIKFVHPRMNVLPSRDVGTQFSSSVPRRDVEIDNDVETFTPTTILRREFKTNPNPNYAKYVSPDNPSLVPKREAASPLAAFQTPGTTYHRGESTPLRTAVHTIKQPNFRQSIGGAVSSGTSMNSSSRDGGSLGIYSHKNSPLKKATSMYDMDSVRHSTPVNSLSAAAREIAEGRDRDRRSISPNKERHEAASRRTSVPPRFNALDMGRSRGPSYY